MKIEFEFAGRGQVVSSILDGEGTERGFLAGSGALPPSAESGVDWMTVTCLSALAVVRAGSQDDQCEIVHHSPNGAVEGSRLKGSDAEYRNHRILTPGDVVTLGRPGERQIVITGRA